MRAHLDADRPEQQRPDRAATTRPDHEQVSALDGVEQHLLGVAEGRVDGDVEVGVALLDAHQGTVGGAPALDPQLLAVLGRPAERVVDGGRPGRMHDQERTPVVRCVPHCPVERGVTVLRAVIPDDNSTSRGIGCHTPTVPSRHAGGEGQTAPRPGTKVLPAGADASRRKGPTW